MSLKHQRSIIQVIKHQFSISRLSFGYPLGVQISYPKMKALFTHQAPIRRHSGRNPASFRHQSRVIQASFKHHYSIIRLSSRGTNFVPLDKNIIHASGTNPASCRQESSIIQASIQHHSGMIQAPLQHHSTIFSRYEFRTP